MLPENTKLSKEEKEKRKLEMFKKYEKYKTSYKTVQTSLKSIIKNAESYNLINENVLMMNKIVIHTYSFLKMYCIKQYTETNTLPNIDKLFINLIMKTICSSDSRGKKKGDEKQQLMNILNDFFINTYKPLMNNETINYTHLNTVLDYESESMITCIINHISERFQSIFNRYVNIIANKNVNESNIKQIFLGKIRKNVIGYYRKDITKLKNYLWKSDNGLNEINLTEYLKTQTVLNNELNNTYDQCAVIDKFFEGSLKIQVLAYYTKTIKAIKIKLSKIKLMISSTNNAIDTNNKLRADIKDQSLVKLIQETIKINSGILGSLQNEVYNNPINMLKLMIYMNIELENKNQTKDSIKQLNDLTNIYDSKIQQSTNENEINKYAYIKKYISGLILQPKIKTFTCFPQRASIIQKCIKLDTTTIVHTLFTEKTIDEHNKSFYLIEGNTKKKENHIWKLFFNTEQLIFKKKGYIFNHSIVTDGFICTLLFIRDDLYSPVKKTQVRSISKPFGYKSEKYIDELSEIEKEQFKIYNLIGIDPGVNNLLFATDGTRRSVMNQKTNTIKLKPNGFSYTKIQRQKELKSKEYSKKLEKHKKMHKLNANNKSYSIGDDNDLLNNNDKTIKSIESHLSNYDSKTCIYENAVNYIQQKNEVNNKLGEYYSKHLFRKLKWYGKINKQKSEANMINNFKNKFGISGKPTNTLICFGDWSKGNTPKNQVSTKGKSLRKLFTDAGFSLVLVDEFRTSKMSYLLDAEQSQKMKKFKMIHSPRPNKKDNLQLCHGLLRSKCVLNNKSDRHLVMNRDLSGSLNILHKAKCNLFSQPIPIYLTRA
jgi:hypothetical protein